MNPSIEIACGFLGGTIFSVEGGYRVLEHPRLERVFDRISDARWFLAVRWCEQCPRPAGILTHEGQLSFQNQSALEWGETLFLPREQRKAIFDTSLALDSGDVATCAIGYPDRPDLQVEVRGVAIDPRYGKVAMVRTL